MRHIVCRTREDAFDRAADFVVRTANAAIADRGRFRIALSGGRTPDGLLERLVGQAPLDWSSIDVFWVDERCVPPSDDASNYARACERLLDRVPIPPANVHRIQADLPPRVAADAYEVMLREVLGDDGRLDLVLLGIGADGHTASLFPRHQALHEDVRWVLPVHTGAVPPWRITMTLPLLNASRVVLFLATGAEKADAVRRAVVGEDLPASRIAPVEGRVVWFVDRAAAAGL